MRLGYRMGVNSLEGYRAQALNAWRAGVDTICLWNFFYVPGQSQFELVNEADDPDILAGLDKMYVPDPLGPGKTSANKKMHGSPGPGLFLAGGERFFNRPVFRPGPLTPGQTRTIHIMVGDDLSSAAARGQDAEVTLEIQIRGIGAPDNLETQCNGTALESAAVADTTLTYPVPTTAVKMGDNLVILSVAPVASDLSPRLEDVRLWVRFPQPCSK